MVGIEMVGIENVLIENRSLYLLSLFLLCSEFGRYWLLRLFFYEKRLYAYHLYTYLSRYKDGRYRDRESPARGCHPPPPPTVQYPAKQLGVSSPAPPHRCNKLKILLFNLPIIFFNFASLFVIGGGAHRKTQLNTFSNFCVFFCVKIAFLCVTPHPIYQF